jgi:hypothetical protein
MARLSWDGLCRQYYEVAANPNVVASFAIAPDGVAHRAWLCGPNVAGSRYVADFATGSLQDWPMREVAWGDGGGRRAKLRLRVLSNTPSVTAFVDAHLLPCLLQTVALLRAATASDPTLDVTFVDSQKRRAMPRAKNGGCVVILPEHINGGVTYHNAGIDATVRVVVYRREDACKVLVHELTHAFAVDGGLWVQTSSAARAADKALASRCNVVSQGPIPMGMSEAYTEALACYLHARWWAGAQRADASGVLGRVAAHIEDVGRRVDAACSDGGRRAFREGTHAFAYAVCRAAVWSTGALPRMLTRWPPGLPPTNPAEFAAFLGGAIDAWKRGGGGGALLPPPAGVPRGLRMTPI